MVVTNLNIYNLFNKIILNKLDFFEEMPLNKQNIENIENYKLMKINPIN
jgi:hypothetical protein